MKVCMTTRCFDFRNAGIGRVSSEIMAGVKARGHEIYPVATEGSMSLYRYYYYVVWGIRKKLPQDCEVYHALTPMETLWTPKKKTVVTFHDLFLLTDPDRVGGGFGYNDLKRDIGREFFKNVCRVAVTSRIIVCVSEKTRQEVLSFFKVPESKVRVIRSGINQSLNYQPRLPNGKFRIGYLGGLDRRKRVNLLVETFKATRGNTELVIGGTGLDERILKNMAKGDHRIKFLGLVPDEDLCSFYNSLDLFAFPSAVEGYGLPPIEAMACKVPIVVLADSLMPHEVKSRCIEVNSPSQMIIPWELSETQLEDNYQFAKSHDWNKCVDEYIKLYEEVAR